MSHPYNSIRESKVQKSRVGHITGRASGGGVSAAGGNLLTGKGRDPLLSRVKGVPDVEGGKMKFRADRVMRKAGGRVKSPAVNVTINTAPKDDKMMMPPPMPMPPPGLMAGPPPGGPPPGAPGPMPGGPPMGGPEGGLPPELMPRKRGGRVGNPVDGSAVNAASGPGWRSGESLKTKVQHDPGKNEMKNMNRKRVVTFATGGGVVSFRAKGGKIEAPQGVAPATKLPGGAGGGKGRLAKAAKYGGK